MCIHGILNIVNNLKDYILYGPISISELPILAPIAMDHPPVGVVLRTIPSPKDMVPSPKLDTWLGHNQQA